MVLPVGGSESLLEDVEIVSGRAGRGEVMAKAKTLRKSWLDEMERAGRAEVRGCLGEE